MSTIIQLSGLNGNWQISGDISGTNKCWVKDNYKLKYNSNGIGWVISDITNNIDLFTINTSGQISGNNYWNPIVWNQNLSQYPSQINKIHISGPKQQKQQYLNMPITFESLEDGNTITLNEEASQDAITCYYKVNNGEWTLYNVGSTVIPSVNTGDKVSFKCDTTTFTGEKARVLLFLI